MTLRLMVVALFLLAACAPQTPPTEVAAFAPNRIISFWETVSEQATGQFRAHPWQFVGQQDNTIRLVLGSQSAGVTLSLEAPDGSTIDRGNDLRATLPVTGIYTATVRFAPGETSTYTLRLEYTDRPDPSIPTLTPTPTTAPTSTPTATLTATPAPTLTPTITPTPTPVYALLGTVTGSLTNGLPQNGVLTGPDEAHVYLFEGVAGQFATIRMARVSGALDPVLALYDPLGQPVASDDNAGGDRGALLRNIRLPQTGEYSLRAAGDGLAGDYRLGLILSTEPEPVTPTFPTPTITPTSSPTPEPESNRLLDHVPLAGSIERPGDFVRYSIAAVEGQVFTLGVSPVPGLDLRPELELYNPQGELAQTATIYTSNAVGDALIPAFQVGETGVYGVLVQAEGVNTGPFLVSYGLGASRENVPRGSLPADTPLSADLSRRGLRDVWDIVLNAGDVITLSIIPQSQLFDPALDLIAPDGSIVAFDDNSGGGQSPLINSFTASVSGLYQARVTGANAASSGPYSIVWRYLTSAPSATPPAATVLIMAVDDRVQPQTYQDYPLQGQAGQRLRIRVTARPGSGLDPVVALLASDGTTLARADDNGADLNPVLDVVLPADGTYFVRVDGYQSTGEFDLIVEAVY